MITGLAHVCFTVNDLDRSTAFYRDVVGMEPAFDFRRPSGELFGRYLRMGRRTFLELFQGQGVAAGGEKTTYRHLCLEVDDIRATADELRRRGADVGEVKLGSDGSWQAWLTDPDGNRIELHQYTPESRQTPFLTEN